MSLTVICLASQRYAAEVLYRDINFLSTNLNLSDVMRFVAINANARLFAVSPFRHTLMQIMSSIYRYLEKYVSDTG